MNTIKITQNVPTHPFAASRRIIFTAWAPGNISFNFRKAVFCAQGPSAKGGNLADTVGSRSAKGGSPAQAVGNSLAKGGWCGGTVGSFPGILSTII